MKVYFRPHRELLQEALKEEKVFNSFGALRQYVKTQTLYNKYGYEKYKNNSGVCINEYGFDKREGLGTTYVITDGDPNFDTSSYGGVIGFAYLRDIDNNKSND